MRLLITGAAGRVGRQLRPRLARAGRTLRLFDQAGQEPAAPDEPVEILRGSVLDPDDIAVACRDTDAVLHLAGIPHEASFSDLVRVNLDGSRAVLEAAHAAGVRRVLLASSIHAVGFVPHADAGPDGVPDDVAARPDTFYGWSKAAMESLGRLFADRFGTDVICLRLGACFPRPPGDPDLPVWLSPDDCARLVEACLTTPAPGFRLVWGMSRNTRRWCSPRGGAALGYHPVDDSEEYARTPVDAAAAAGEVLGGLFPTHPLGEPHRFRDSDLH